MAGEQSEIDLLFRRRSIKRLAEPAPTDDELQTMLRAAAAAPDHGGLRPWKFLVLRGANKDAFGSVLADAYLRRVTEEGAEPIPAALEKERTKLGRAPLVVVVAAVHRHHDKITWDDQLGAAYAAAQNLCLAATALGYGSMWRTGKPTSDPSIKRVLGLSEHDAIVAFLYVGTIPPDAAKEPHDPSLEGLVEEWTPSAFPPVQRPGATMPAS